MNSVFRTLAGQFVEWPENSGQYSKWWSKVCPVGNTHMHFVRWNIPCLAIMSCLSGEFLASITNPDIEDSLRALFYLYLYSIFSNIENNYSIISLYSVISLYSEKWSCCHNQIYCDLFTFLGYPAKTIPYKYIKRGVL